MKKKNDRNHFKRCGVLVLCLLITLTFTAGIGNSTAVFADTLPEAEDVIEIDDGTIDNEMYDNDSNDGEAQDDIITADESGPANENDAGEEAADISADAEVTEDVGLYEDESAAMECLSDFDMGTLVAGYSQADANEHSVDIVLKNTGNVSLDIDPSKINVDNSIFVLSFSDEIKTIEPGQELIIGAVKPRHQLKAGIYKSNLSLYDKDYRTYVRSTAMLTVLSRTTDFSVTNEKNDDVTSVTFGYDYEGIPKQDSRIFKINNNSTGKVRFSIISDNSLFKTAFADEDITSDTLIEGGDAAEVTISLNTRKAASLTAGTYSGHITISAVSEDGVSSKEILLPVEYLISEKPAWRQEVISENILEMYAGWGLLLLYVDNTIGISGSTENYLMADLDEGDDIFDIEVRSSSSFKLTPKETLTAGRYTVKADLYFDPEGHVDIDNDFYCGTCTYTLNVIPDDYYGLEIINELDDDGYISLGTLTEGYTAEDVEKISRTYLQFKNTGTADLNVSSEGLHFSYDEGNFEHNETGSEKLASGAVYDKIWVQPVVGLGAGTYTADVWLYDDDDKTYAESEEVRFIVVKDGINYTLELSGGIFDSDTEIGEEGIDFGTAAPDSESKKIQKYVYFYNIGSVPLKVSPSIVNDASSGIFSVYTSGKADGEFTLKPGDYKGMRIECDPTNVAGNIGEYTANLKLVTENADNSEESKTVLVPLAFRIANTETCELTIDFQGKGGTDYPNTTIEVAKGTSYTDGITAIMSKITKIKYGTIPWPTDDEYTMISMTKLSDEELARLGTWEAAMEAQKEIMSGTITEDTTVYVNWAKKVNNAVLSVDVPSCGEAIPEEADVKVDEEDVHYYVAEANWQAGSDETAFTAGNRYGLNVKLSAEFGYAIAADCNCTINGKTALNVTPDGSTRYSAFETSVLAEGHELGDWYPAGSQVHAARCSKCHQIVKENHNYDLGEEIIEPTCTEPGKVVYTCTDCGYEHFETVPALEHKLINKTLDTEASDTTYGIYLYECEHCHEIFEEDFWYAATNGNNAVWYRDSNSMLDITFTRFSECYEYPDMTFDFDMDQPRLQFILDGQPLEHGKYSLTTYNDIETRIGLFADDLNLLSDGEHTLSFVYEDGMRTAFFNVKTPKYVDTIDLDIKSPVCGESAKYGYDKYYRLKAENAPVITLPDNCGYSIAESYSITRWTNEKMEYMWEGTFCGGETAYAAFYLVPDEGYAFINEPTDNGANQIFTGTILVNGKEVTPIRNRYVSYLVSFVVPVEAVHKLDGISYTWADDFSSVTASGTCSDKSCGAVVTEKAKTTSTVTKEPTYTSTGILKYTAVFENPAFKKQVHRVRIPKKKKLANTLTVTGSTVSVSYAALQKQNQSLGKAIKVKNAKGTVTYEKTRGNDNIVINKRTGVISVKKKGLVKGRTYSIFVRVTAAGTSTGDPQYKSGKKMVKVLVKVNK